MTEHQKEHLVAFSQIFKDFSNAVEETLTNPTAVAGYKLHRLHELAVFNWMQTLHVLATEPDTDEAPEEGAPEPPKALVN